MLSRCVSVGGGVAGDVPLYGSPSSLLPTHSNICSSLRLSLRPFSPNRPLPFTPLLITPLPSFPSLLPIRMSCASRLVGHSGTVQSLVLGPDVMVTGSRDRQIKVRIHTHSLHTMQKHCVYCMLCVCSSSSSCQVVGVNACTTKFCIVSYLCSFLMVCIDLSIFNDNGVTGRC